ncbi:MAG TPA: hypothetical protein DCG57_01570 [Candidatus Riflebacteria bacterium]|jgi:hypothetical protein|nr:hypothetical protein [Candidatus Riflebacteria bacterium]
MTENNKPDEQSKPEDDDEDIYIKLNAFRPPECKLKKHPCKDCFNCLFCGDARCEICLKSKNCHANNKKAPEKSDK